MIIFFCAYIDADGNVIGGHCGPIPKDSRVGGVGQIEVSCGAAMVKDSVPAPFWRAFQPHIRVALVDGKYVGFLHANADALITARFDVPARADDMAACLCSEAPPSALVRAWLARLMPASAVAELDIKNDNAKATAIVESRLMRNIDAAPGNLTLFNRRVETVKLEKK